MATSNESVIARDKAVIAGIQKLRFNPLVAEAV